MQNPGQKARAATVVTVFSATVLAATPSAALAGAIAPDSSGSGNADAALSNYWLILGLGLIGLLALSAIIARSLRARLEPDRGEIPGGGFQRGALAAGSLVAVAIGVFALLSYDNAYTPEASSNGAFKAVADETAGDFTAVYRQPRDRQVPSGPTVTVDVNGQRYLWRYRYHNIPGQSPAKALFSYHDLIVPEDTTILLNITSSDVTHSWWVPELGGKFDAIPNYINKTWFKVDKPGVFEGACAEICGANHSEMTNRVRVVTTDQFAAWAKSQGAAIDGDRQKLRESITQASEPDVPQAVKPGVERK